MRVFRAIVALSLTCLMVLGELTALSCPMMSVPAQNANSHEHGQVHPQAVHSSHDGSIAQEQGSGERELPSPCIMALNCGGPGITQGRVAMEPQLSLPSDRSKVTILSYVDPVLLSVTPPPRI